MKRFLATISDFIYYRVTPAVGFIFFMVYLVAVKRLIAKYFVDDFLANALLTIIVALFTHPAILALPWIVDWAGFSPTASAWVFGIWIALMTWWLIVALIEWIMPVLEMKSWRKLYRKYFESVDTGPYVDGKRHGQWEERFPYGAVATGPYVNGEKHGKWEERLPDGRVQTGSYVDGKKHGQWEERYPDGRVETGPFVNGKQHGQWEMRWPDGTVATVPYVDGKAHGQWEERGPDGRFLTGPIMDGEMHGQWEERLANGTVEIDNFINGELQE